MLVGSGVEKLYVAELLNETANCLVSVAPGVTVRVLSMTCSLD